MPNFISPTGFIDQDKDCTYSLNGSNIRSREYIDPKTDLAFYFKNYLVPKYGLHNLHVNNCAGFMKDLEINWSKLDTDTKSKVLDILVDGILSNNYDFKSELLAKLEISNPPSIPLSSRSLLADIDFNPVNPFNPGLLNPGKL